MERERDRERERERERECVCLRVLTRLSYSDHQYEKKGHVFVCCSMLKRVAVCCTNHLEDVDPVLIRPGVLTRHVCCPHQISQNMAHIVACCNVLWCVAVCCSVLQCVALLIKHHKTSRTKKHAHST